MPSRVLVTGGAGFIGSHLSEALLSAGYSVRVLDDLSMGRRGNVSADCEFIEGSIADDACVQQALQDVQFICHEAARVTIRGSVEGFYDDAETNLMGTLKLLQWAGKLGVKRFVYASSMAVYADAPRPDPVPETHPLMPASPYGIAKLAAERYVLMLGPVLGIEPVVLRYFNTFGTRQTFTPYVGVITIFVTKLLRKEPITIFGDGLQTRDFTHVSDIVQANLLSLTATIAAGQVFNVGSGKGTTVADLSALLKSRIWPDAPTIHEAARGEELKYSIADVTRARTILGYQPNTDLDTQLPDVIQSISASLR